VIPLLADELPVVAFRPAAPSANVGGIVFCAIAMALNAESGSALSELQLGARPTSESSFTESLTGDAGPSPLRIVRPPASTSQVGWRCGLVRCTALLFDAIQHHQPIVLGVLRDGSTLIGPPAVPADVPQNVECARLENAGGEPAVADITTAVEIHGIAVAAEAPAWRRSQTVREKRL